jgi:hypothetical protein
MKMNLLNYAVKLKQLHLAENWFHSLFPYSSFCDCPLGTSLSDGKQNGIDGCTHLSEASDLLLESGAPNLESHLLQPENERQLFQIAKRTELGEMAVFYFQPKCF